VALKKINCFTIILSLARFRWWR